MKKSAFILWFLLAAASWAGQPFTLLFFNDFHAHLEPFEAVKGEGEVGGLARLAGVANAVRAENAAAGVPTFLVIAGDVLQGTPYSTVYRGEAEFAALNEVGVTAMCLGNHEFDYGQENLRHLIEKADFPVISANVLVEGAAGNGAFTEKTVWLEAGEAKILVIGLTTPETPITTAPRNVVGLTFADPAETASALVNEYEAQADVFVALTHLGFENDLELARAVPELDVVVGGHTHTLVAEPVAAGNAVVCSAYEYGIYLGRMDLEVADDGGVVVTDYDLLPVTAASPEVEAVAAVIDEYKSGLSEKLDVVVGSVDTVLERQAITERETNFGDFVADVTREAAAAEIALVNAGGVRADLGPGKITLGDVLTALPFGNEIVVLAVPGATLRAAFEYCVREKVGEGGFLQVSGIEYAFTTGRELAEVTVGGEALADDKVYQVALPDFLAEGGDGYAMFAELEGGYKTGLVLYDVVASALREGRAVPAEPAGRIRVLAE
jgi:2',3'-cyclic-nucleotide 2'-phosphodiesterase (5'-nucleotidase family)